MLEWKKNMETIRSLEDLNRFREEISAEKCHTASSDRIRVTVGLGACGIAAGALDVLKAIQEQLNNAGLKDVCLSQTGCVGLCRYEPIVEIALGEAPAVTYGRVTPEAARRIVREHILGGSVIEELVIDTAPFPTI
jgi:(2Fe-2S) ferredoxin